MSVASVKKYWIKSFSQHLMGWSSLLLVFSIVESIFFRQPFWFVLTNEFINLSFYVLAIYLNIYYLIPNLLAKNKFWQYALILIAIAFIVTPLKTLVLYLKASNFPDLQQQLISELDYNFLATFMIVATSTIWKIMVDWLRQLREQQDLEKKTMQSELRFLKSQINPHFLFNTLNNLYALTIKKSDQAPEIVLKLSEMMRYMLYECNERRVPLSKEVTYMRNYLDLERLRQRDRVEISFETQGDIEKHSVAPLLFTPFLENCFKHGIHHSIDAGYVRLLLDVSDEELTFYIENSKPQQVQLPDTRRVGGIGLTNLRSRLKILYPNAYSLNIDDNPNYYGVSLQINLEKDRKTTILQTEYD